ncbi:MAG: CHAT domain-containing protein [Saprospiraceae bacterium]
MSKRTIQQIIGRGHLDKAIELMLDLAPKYADSSTENLLISLSGQYYNNEKSKRSGALSDENYKLTLARINNALTSTLSDDYSEIDAQDIPEEYKKLAKAEVEGNNGDLSDNGDSTSQESNIILFLSANPSKTALLQLDKEHARIATKLEASKMEVRSRKAISLSEFQESIFLTKPRIVHFSGHGDLKSPEIMEAYRGIGASKSEAKKEIPEPGIILYDEDKRNPFFVKSTVLRRIFKSMVERQKIPIEAVLFNACYSEGQAKAVSEIGINVIGTSSAVSDEAAIAFATGFYFGVAQGESIEDAFDLAINQVLAYNEPEDRFTFYKNGEKIEF